MTIDAVLAVYEPSKDLRLLIGVPVGVALITGFLTGAAGIVVALLSSKRQADLAAQAQQAQADLAHEDRRAARQREDRDRRERHRLAQADVHDAIIAAALQFSNESVEGVPPAEASRAVARAMSGIISRLGDAEVYYAAVGVLNEADQYDNHKQRMVILGIVMIRLDEWFLGRRPSAEIVALLDEAATASQADRSPTK